MDFACSNRYDLIGLRKAFCHDQGSRNERTPRGRRCSTKSPPLDTISDEPDSRFAEEPDNSLVLEEHDNVFEELDEPVENTAKKQKKAKPAVANNTPEPIP